MGKFVWVISSVDHPLIAYDNEDDALVRAISECIGKVNVILPTEEPGEVRDRTTVEYTWGSKGSGDIRSRFYIDKVELI